MEKKMKIKVLVDSASDINQIEAEKLGLAVMPIEVRFKDEVFNSDVASYMIGCTIGTHIGPGAIGVAFF
ncbi:MAG: hypothetical protein E7345_00615 [Clostridiales bacterium]|nr:hypothetical protein [Clostridiales bacterium]